MEKILSQHRWDRLPVNTFARLYQYADGQEQIMHAVRVPGHGKQQTGSTALLGDTEWRDAFNAADVAFALHVPATHHLTIGDVINNLRRMTPWAEVEIACGTRRFRPVSLTADADTSADAALLEIRPMDYTAPVTTRNVVRRLSSIAVRNSAGDIHPTPDTARLSVKLDGIEWALTEVRQEGEGAVITATPLGEVAAEQAQPATAQLVESIDAGAW